ncbi:methyl-accepting chemotaxis protein [Vibrio sp. JC009]|uniref:methyl-accepting chemotaxis protein n=1 Tax=Vibrio sp. JC009 TaxID=2912314 RepID=UPI0023B19613|nr:methyl-accepting chemotaxis protein [Vibrio sp. JC009]WED20780.1 methyl-accepting chemotaxis protein [Vibrio sp. JC009]
MLLIIVNGWFIASSAQQQVREEIELGLRDQVDAAAAAIDEIIIRSDHNITKAKPQIVDFMNSFRWDGGSGYLFINETLSNTQVHHVVKPELNGQPTVAITLLSGGTLEQTMQEVVRAQQARMVHYEFNNPATGKVEEKATYIAPLKQRNWVLSSGVYVSRAEHAFMQVLKQVIMGILALIVCVIFLIIIISRFFKNKIGWIQRGLESKFGDSVADTENTNEIAQLETGVNVLFTTFNRVINVLGDSTSRVAAAAAQQQIMSKSATSGMSDQKREIEEFATAMNEMAATVSEVANNSNTAADEISRVKELAQGGESSMQKTAGSITNLSSELAVSGNVIEQLEKDSKQIESVVDVISDIADQTNLLALNAAIEAARAGEQGRGFAVVADEVRELAQKTTHSTSEIRTMIEHLQERVSEVVENIASSINNAKASVGVANESQQKMSAITALLDGLADMTAQIATASEEQSAVSEEMSKNITVINDIASETHNLVKNSDRASREIHELVTQVYQEVNTVKISDPVYHLSLAKMAHQLWLGRINNYLAGKEHLHEGEGSCHHSCQLGQWYNKEALVELRHIGGVNELDKPHQAFHAKIAELKRAKESGKLDEAEKIFKELMKTSEQVVELLEEINVNIEREQGADKGGLQNELTKSVA